MMIDLGGCREDGEIEQIILFHKHTPVLLMALNTADCSIYEILEVYNKKHLPVFNQYSNFDELQSYIAEWMIERSIPLERPFFKEFLEQFKIEPGLGLIEKCMGLSLTDQYWICPKEKDISWDKINFFQNEFSLEIGQLLVGFPKNSNIVYDLKTPDFTSDGVLIKRWIIANNKRMLIKGGSISTNFQEPFNEVIASLIMEALSINHVTYNLIWLGSDTESKKMPYCTCECFITPDTELIKASQILEAIEKPPNTSTYQHFINCCHALGIKDFVQSLDQMLLVDFLIANEDRHFNNFGFIRNASTLEWIGFAPIYDSGSSFWCSTMNVNDISIKNDRCKPFFKYHYQQIKCVSKYDIFDLTAIEDDHFVNGNIKKYLSYVLERQRVEVVISQFKKRIGLIKKLIHFQKSGIPFDPEKDHEFNSSFNDSDPFWAFK